MRVYQEQAVGIQLHLVALDCAVCGVVFAITTEFNKRKREVGDNFYCPNGHTNYYGDSELEKAKKQAGAAKAKAEAAERRMAGAEDDARREREWRQTAERSLSATKGVVTKMRKRAQAGVCPVPGCKRSFGPDTALARHLATNHPDWKPEEQT